jgi:hypothetical protein
LSCAQVQKELPPHAIRLSPLSESFCETLLLLLSLFHDFRFPDIGKELQKRVRQRYFFNGPAATIRS